MSLSCGFCLGNPSDTYNSAQFSDAFHALSGDGVALWGGRLAASVNGFTVTVASGYAVAAGRWVKNDEPLSLTLQPSGDHDDRTDALVVRVDGKARRAAIEVVGDVEADKLPGALRAGDAYCVVLYLFRVRRGATTLTPEDVTDLRGDADLCGTLAPLSDVSGRALEVYQFVTSGIGAEIDKILARSKALVDRADAAVADLSADIQSVGGAVAGKLCAARRPPGQGWILCDGGKVPAGYPELSALLGGVLPDLSRAGDRYRAYIYGGEPGTT